MKLFFSEEIYGIKWGYFDYIEDDFIILFCIVSVNPLSDDQIDQAIKEYTNLSYSEKYEYSSYVYKKFNISLNNIDVGKYNDFMWIKENI
jgi:hypothetical protein